MLSATLRSMAVAVLGALLLTLGVVPVQAAPAGCRDVLNPDGTVTVVCDDDGDAGGGPGEGDGGSAVCRFNGQEIACTSRFGTWDGRCYVRGADPEPETGTPVWEGNTDGVILECNPYECVAAGVDPCADRSFYLAPNPPAAGPSPEELARRAVAQMRLTMGEIGSTPPTTSTKPAAMGVIGLPIWLWVANRAENTTGPITRTAADGGLSVSATGTLDRITWTLTEVDTGIARATVTCRAENAAGTPYDGRDNASQSPTCGIPANLNQHAGRFTLTATAHWTVEWQGGGQSGTINVPPQANSVPVTIGELQVLLSH